MEEFNFDAFIGWDDGADPSLWDSSTIQSRPLEQSVPEPQTSRNYRPRNPRSCDFCRARKTACRIEHDPPCNTCKTMGKECTFAERPRKRKRRVVNSPESLSRTQEHISSRYVAKSVSLPSDTSVQDQALLSMTVPEQSYHEDESLDLRPTSIAFLLGDTGESDPHLLKHSDLTAHDHPSATKISYRRMYREGYDIDENSRSLDQEKPIVFLFAEHSLHDKYEPRVENDVLKKAGEELENTCSDEVGVRLIMLYFRYVYPYFPVLSRSQMLLSDTGMKELVRSLPLSLKATLYAIGLPFMVYDDVLATTLDLAPPSGHSLYRIAWLAIAHEIHTPHLSTLQACLLLLQRVNDDRYVMDSPFRWSLAAWTVGLAQSLGLSTDCSTWQGLPAWEKRLRRRLWWATYVMDKWSFMSAGLCSHIKKDDFDVVPLTSADFCSDTVIPQLENTSEDDLLHEKSHFFHLSELSMILSDIMDSFFSIRASKITASNFVVTLELAKPIRSRLQSWKESFDIFVSLQQNSTGDQARLDGNASLGLAYPVATMILFRALLRPLESSSGSEEDKIMRESGREAVRVGARACCVEVVQYLEQVKRGVWDAFWHSWSRASFAIASSFMMRLLITSTSSAEIQELNALITRWRWAMRTGGGSAGNVLMSLGLLRLDRSLLKSGIRKSQGE